MGGIAPPLFLYQTFDNNRYISQNYKSTIPASGYIYDLSVGLPANIS